MFIFINFIYQYQCYNFKLYIQVPMSDLDFIYMTNLIILSYVLMYYPYGNQQFLYIKYLNLNYIYYLKNLVFHNFKNN
jgi:hypothetical protein